LSSAQIEGLAFCIYLSDATGQHHGNALQDNAPFEVLLR
jgi:hypothetical protein